MRAEQRLHLLRIDIETADEHKSFFVPGYVYIPVFINMGEVAGEQPAALEKQRCVFRFSEVFAHNVAAPNAKLACLAGRKRIAVLVNDFHGYAFNRRAYGTGLHKLSAAHRIDRSHRPALRYAVPLIYVRVKTFHKPVVKVVRQRSASGHYRPHKR
jgi:hypothetical protein